MRTTVDELGRVVVPKPLRDALGLEPGTEVDVSAYGRGAAAAAAEPDGPSDS